MKKKMAVALIASMTVAAGAGSVVVQAAPQEAKAESITESADVISMDFAEKDIYYMGAGENDETIILGASEDLSDYEAVITADSKMMVVTSRDQEKKDEKEASDATVSVEISEDKESVTVTLPDGSKITAERSDFMKSLMKLMGAVDVFESAVERGELGELDIDQ